MKLLVNGFPYTFTAVLILLLQPVPVYSFFGPKNFKECELEAYKNSKNKDELGLALNACEMQFKEGVSVNPILGPKSRKQCELVAFQKSKTVDEWAIAMNACALEFKEFTPDAYEKGTCALYWNGHTYVGGSKDGDPSFTAITFEAPSGIKPRVYMHNLIYAELGLNKDNSNIDAWQRKALLHLNDYFHGIESTCQRILNEYR